MNDTQLFIEVLVYCTSFWYDVCRAVYPIFYLYQSQYLNLCT